MTKRKLRPIDRHEIGRRAFVELVDEEHLGADMAIWKRASDELKQHYFDRHIPQVEQARIRLLIAAGPPVSSSQQNPQ